MNGKHVQQINDCPDYVNNHVVDRISISSSVSVMFNFMSNSGICPSDGLSVFVIPNGFKLFVGGLEFSDGVRNVPSAVGAGAICIHRIFSKIPINSIIEQFVSEISNS